MNHSDIRTVVAAVLAEQQGQIETVSQKAVADVLLSFGFEDEDRKEMKADFQHLRKWRRSVEQAQSLTFKVVLTTIVTGFVAVVWMGVKTFLGK